MERCNPSEASYDFYLNWLKDDIEEKQKQIRQIDEELSELGLCWFGVKRRHKKSLIHRRSDLKKSLSESYDLMRAYRFGI